MCDFCLPNFVLQTYRHGQTNWLLPFKHICNGRTTRIATFNFHFKLQTSFQAAHKMSSKSICKLLFYFAFFAIANCQIRVLQPPELVLQFPSSVLKGEPKVNIPFLIFLICRRFPKLHHLVIHVQPSLARAVCVVYLLCYMHDYLVSIDTAIAKYYFYLLLFLFLILRFYCRIRDPILGRTPHWKA